MYKGKRDPHVPLSDFITISKFQSYVKNRTLISQLILLPTTAF